MKSFYTSVILISSFSLLADDIRVIRNLNQPADTSWTIVGAGPAGIVTVGLLLDLGIEKRNIIWVDPEFNVGRLGKYYANVPGNTKTQLFIDFFKACGTFCECHSPSVAKLQQYDLEKAYPLSIVIQPLQEITEYLLTKVRSYRSMLNSLHFEQDVWHLGIQDHNFTSHHVVLATGSHPRSLEYECKCEIPLDIALNKHALEKQISSNDTIGVVGSAHSAILILKYLTELPVARILNFYIRNPQFAVDMGSWVLHGYDGLGGVTAQWAQNVLLQNPPAKLMRIHNTRETRKIWLPICTKIIYAVGYERNEIPFVHQNPELAYNQAGVIAPRLFGIGIAFPEVYVNPQGTVERKVGLAHFMEYAQRVIPDWITTKNARKKFAAFEKLFTIELL